MFEESSSNHSEMSHSFSYIIEHRFQYLLSVLNNVYIYTRLLQLFISHSLTTLKQCETKLLASLRLGSLKQRFTNWRLPGFQLLRVPIYIKRPHPYQRAAAAYPNRVCQALCGYQRLNETQICGTAICDRSIVHSGQQTKHKLEVIIFHIRYFNLTYLMLLELIWDIRRKPTLVQTILRYGLLFSEWTRISELSSTI